MKKPNNSTLNIRRAEVEDAPALGELGKLLSLQHFGYDEKRFSLPEPIVENYSAFLNRQLS